MLVTGRDVRDVFRARRSLTLGPSPTFICQAQIGDSVHPAFVITNTGTRPVELLGLRRNCGCVHAPNIFPREVLPHTSWVLQLTVNVGKADAQGEFVREAELYSDADVPLPLLHIRAHVLRPATQMVTKSGDFR